MSAYPDKFFSAYEKAVTNAKQTAYGLEPMRNYPGQTLDEDTVRANFDKMVKPILMSGNTNAALRWAARYAPPGADPYAELRKLMQKYGSE